MEFILPFFSIQSEWSLLRLAVENNRCPIIFLLASLGANLDDADQVSSLLNELDITYELSHVFNRRENVLSL